MQLPIFLLGALALLPLIHAQTFTTCNPLNTTCPSDPALSLNHTFVFNTSTTVTSAFNLTAGALQYGTNGAEFTINKKGDCPTIVSNFYIFFGSVSVFLRAAPGTGIISSIVLESDDLDEVDWEFMGGNATFAETNYFGKGNTASYDRAIYYPVSSDVRADFHNYTVDWTREKLEWWIDGSLVRTLKYEDANGGKNYPQTPMTVRMGVWSGGDDSQPEGTVEWAGGKTTYEGTPYTMYVLNATVNDYSTGSEYAYTDKTGNWESIKVISGNSTAAASIQKALLPHLSLSQKFAALPSSTKTAIYASSGVVGALALSAFLFICCRMRRAGRKEADNYNALVNQQREDAHKEQMELRSKGLGGFRNSSALSVNSYTSTAPLNGEKSGGGGASPMSPKWENEGLMSPALEPPSRAGTASPLERSMSPPVLVPIPRRTGSECSLLGDGRAGGGRGGGGGGNLDLNLGAERAYSGSYASRSSSPLVGRGAGAF